MRMRGCWTRSPSTSPPSTSACTSTPHWPAAPLHSPVQAQAPLAAHPGHGAASSAEGAAVAAYNFAFFSSVAGFFVLEDSIMKGDNELMSRAEVDGLFDMATQKVRAVVKEQTAHDVQRQGVPQHQAGAWWY